MSALKSLTQDLSGAKDETLAQVVAVVDGLHQRGTADRLIAPLRPRLAHLRPARPLRLARLLFLPLDPLIVAPPRWRPGTLTIPRSVVTPCAEAVRSALPPPLLAMIEQMVAGATTADTEVIAKAGALLWPAAASMFLGPFPPVDWGASGLPEAEHRPVCTGIGVVLMHALTLHELRSAARLGTVPDMTAAERMMRTGAAHGPAAVARLLALVLGSLPDATAFHRMAEGRTGLATGGRAAVESAVAFFLDGLDDVNGAANPLAICGLADAGSTVRRIAGVLDELADGSGSPERRQRIAGIRREIDAGCRKRFASAIETELLQPLAEPGGALSDAAVMSMEEAGRGLRRLEQAARRIGGGSTYDTLLRQTTDTIANEETAAALGLVDRVRMVEILAGPERALALLDGTAPA